VLNLEANEAPRITVVTPSYNQGDFLGECIDSVLSQQYPNLEYIIVDGGSLDDSLEIIRAFSDKLAWWVSEPDRGQSHALNKGFARATGDIYCWINSDDLMAPGSLHVIGDYFSRNKDVAWCTGGSRYIDHDHIYEKEVTASAIQVAPGDTLAQWLTHMQTDLAVILQSSTYWRSNAWKKIGPLREDFHFSFDFDFFYKVRKEFGPPAVLNKCLSEFRIHPDSKTVSCSGCFLLESIQIAREQMLALNIDEQKQVREWLFAVRERECFLRQQMALKAGDMFGHWQWRMQSWFHRLLPRRLW